eukprot:GHVR01053978.1.p1 GENE.GHVR01053978.1~~GHVR01053978.1.p1  ORF type:complete len:106 (-),score=11.08 GHVR01053978.1:57-374(-)
MIETGGSPPQSSAATTANIYADRADRKKYIYIIYLDINTDVTPVRESSSEAIIPPGLEAYAHMHTGKEDNISEDIISQDEVYGIFPPGLACLASWPCTREYIKRR